MVDICDRLLQVVVIFLAELHDPVFAIKTLSDDLVGLDKLVNFSRQFVVLVADHADVIVHRVDFHLEVGIVLEEGTVRVAGALKLFAHVE